MKKKLSALIIYALALTVNFYILPVLIKNTGLGILMILLIIPLFTVTFSVIYGVRRGFEPLLPIITAIMFIPTIFIFYNSSALVYIIAYAVATLAGNGLGTLFYNKR